jgi:hypothetical protein
MIRSMRVVASGLLPFAWEGVERPGALEGILHRWRDRLRASARRARYRPEKRYMRGGR